MKLQGRRQSKNVDDIRKQKPKPDIGYSMVTRDTAGNKVGGELMNTKSVVSKKKSDMTPFNYDDRGVKMAKKIGMHKMEAAAEADHQKNELAASKQADIDAALDRAFSDANRGDGTVGGMKPREATANAMSKPKVLKEIWTPRPLK